MYEYFFKKITYIRIYPVEFENSAQPTTKKIPRHTRNERKILTGIRGQSPNGQVIEANNPNAFLASSLQSFLLYMSS